MFPDSLHLVTVSCPMERRAGRRLTPSREPQTTAGPLRDRPRGGEMVGTRFRILLLWFLAAAALGVTLAQGAAAAPMTPAGWRLMPAGTETTVQLGPGLAGPWGVAMAPDGGSLLVTSSGTAAQFESVERFDLASL